MKDFINDNFFQLTILAMIIAIAICMWIWADNWEKYCKNNNDNQLCQSIQEEHRKGR